MNKQIKFLLIAMIFLVLTSTASAEQFIDNNQTDFSQGNHTNTFFNTSINALQLNFSQSNGTFLSQVFNAGSLASWTNLSWTEGAPYKEELSDNQEVETVPGGINMTGNHVLLHLNNDSTYGESFTHIFDFSGNSFNGSWQGDASPDSNSGPTSDGRINGAFMFDGTGDAITGSLTGATKTFTLSAWIKPDVLSGVRGVIGYTSSGGVRQDLYQFNQVVRIFADGKYYATTSNVITQTGKWYHIAGTYTEGDSKPKVYVNGIEYALGSASNIGTYTANQFWVGRIAPTGSYNFDGTIDEVAIWDRAFTQQEIQNIYKRGTLELNISVRTCNDPNCDGESWNQTFNQPSTNTLNLEPDQYFQYKSEFQTENTNQPPELYNISINYDILDNTPPIINLLNPENDTTNTTDKTPEFTFEATDETAQLLECSLWKNETTSGTAEIKSTNSSVNNGSITTLTPSSPLANGEYTWWINCSDGYNSNISEIRTINMSVPDTTPPTISLESPENNTINTTNNTPQFGFIPSDNKAEVLSCELWLNSTYQGIPQAYGTNPSVDNGTLGTITANESLPNQNYTWWINCSDGANTELSERRNIKIHVDVNAPSVDLNNPSNNSIDFSNINFTTTATDDIALANATLYSDYGGVWQAIETKIISGINSIFSFVKNILPSNQFINNHFKWNVLVTDNSSKSNWSSTNNTFSNWDLGTHSNTLFNNTLNALTLNDYTQNGVYLSQIFDAGEIVGWKNISWSEETQDGGALPDNKGSDSRINMLDNQLLIHLNDGDGATTFDDSSGENNDGSCAGDTCPTWNSTGKFGGAYFFDSTDEDIILGPSSNALTGDNSQTLTISTWFKTTSSQAMYIASLKRQSVGAGYSTLFSITANNNGAGSIGLLTYSGSSHTNLDVPGSYNDGEWHNIVGVINGSNRTIYVDGIPKDSDLQGMNQVTGNTAEFTIGGFAPGWGSLFFDGTIDEVAVWNRSLSAEEILRIYNQTAATLQLSVRSCDEENCDTEQWSSTLSNSTLSIPPVSSNQYFQYKAEFESTSSTESPKLFNVTINYGDPDGNKPNINLISPANNAGNNGNITTFRFNVSDESTITNCKLILNNEVYRTNTTIKKDTTQEFILENLNADTYLWKINCTDSSNNQNSSETRAITIVPSYDYGGQTTDLSQVDVNNIPNLVIENPSFGLINFSESINLSGGANINDFVTISHNLISIDSNNLPQLNKSATLTLYNLSFQNPVILKNDKACQDCEISAYTADRNLTFTVQSFSNYSASENSQLEIFDSTENIRSFSSEVSFYANFTNTTSGSAISSGACGIDFTDISDTMTFNSTSGLFEYNRTLAVGVHYYNVSCYATGYTTLNTTDNANIDSIENPNGANVTVISSERASSDNPENTTAYAGNITSVDISGRSTTQSWQGYFGNVTGTIQLEGANGSVFYNWSASSPSGEVYATRAQEINFATIACASQQTIINEESFIGQNSNDSDSVTNTFNSNLHPEFFVGKNQISANSCNATNIFGPSGEQSTSFFEVLLADGAQNIVYTSILEQDTPGFNSRPHDFQMIVGENGHGTDTETTSYYFYVELH
jgi:hypothetical protein